MGIGKGTLRAVFDAVSENGISSRKEIADALGISAVSAHKAVDILCGAGLLEIDKELSKSTSRGRKTESVIVSRKKLCLVIDFCKKNTYYSLSTLGNRINNIQVVPYSDSQDLEINFDISATEILKFIEINEAKPSFVAVAIPDFDDNFNTKDCIASLEKFGLAPDIVVSGARGASEFCSSLFCGRYAFVSVDNRAWGCSSLEPERMIPWESIKVGAHHGESFASVLQYESDEQKLCVYANRFINTIDAVLSPDRIFVAATSLPESVMAKLCENDKVCDISGDSPVLNGLLRLSKNKIFESSDF